MDTQERDNFAGELQEKAEEVKEAAADILEGGDKGKRKKYYSPSEVMKRKGCLGCGGGAGVVALVVAVVLIVALL